ncbi:head-tail connector protein [Pararhodobacter oceanensis]|uniref:head-tail connector protein n=1 Tax=Pararhodobacter oceanensis TaxID=2172121 RepID=UPI003A94F26B
MNLKETSTVAEAALPVAALREHLRLGAGFADEASADALLARYLRAAIAVIEARCGKVLLARDYQLSLRFWRWPEAQALPLAPVSVVASVTLRDAAAAAVLVDPSLWRLAEDMHRPQLIALGATLPAMPPNGTVEIAFTAGFGAAWEAVPADLRQAVMLLAAQYYEHRSDALAALPAGVPALLARWMPLRLTAGGHR